MSHIYYVRCAAGAAPRREYCMTRVVLYAHNVSKAVEKAYFFAGLAPLISQLGATNHGSDRAGRLRPLGGSVFRPYRVETKRDLQPP